jgi:hypothetical protein
VIHYVVVTGAWDAVKRLESQFADALQATRYFNGAPVQHRSPSGAWAVAAIAQSDPMCADRIAVADEAMAVVNGPVLARRGDTSQLADDVLKSFTESGTTGATAQMAGGYNVVAVTPPTGLRAFVDFSGTTPLYWYQGVDFAMFSNRPSTIAALSGSEGWDLDALSWLLSVGTLHGAHMPRIGVRHLPPGLEAMVAWRDWRVELDRSQEWVWPAASGIAGRAELTPSEWDEVTEGLLRNFRALHSLKPPAQLWLSGGKDSRLCLALSKAAGLADVLEVRTIGSNDGAEMQCAAAAADAAGFKHVAIEPTKAPERARAGEQRASPDQQSAHWWRRMRQHSYRYDAIVSPWDGLNDPRTNTRMNIRGIGGELYRRGNNKRVRYTDFESIDQLADTYATGADPLRVVRHDVLASQRAWRTEWLEAAASSVRFDAVPERWYVDFRLSHWNGPLAQSKPGFINLVPLISALAARKNLELSSSERSSDRLHYEVIRRAAPELVTVPFADDTWAPSIASAPAELVRNSRPDQGPPTLVPMKRRIKRDIIEQEAARIEHLLADAERETKMGDICDIPLLRRKICDAAHIRPRGKRQIYGAIGVAIALLGQAEQAVDDLA